MSTGVAGQAAAAVRGRVAMRAGTRASGQWRGRVTAHQAAVAALTAAAAAAYAGFGLALQATFRTTTYDLVIFDQAVRSYAHFRPGIAIIKGIHNGGGPDFSVLGDHWSPILAAVAPLYWLHDGPQTLLVTQGACFAAAVPLIWLFARRLAAAHWPGPAAAAVAYLAAAAYALSWPVAEALAAGFHEVAFVPVLTAAFFERMSAGRPRAALIAAGLLLFVKEDMGLLIAGFGLWLLVSRARVPRQRLVAAVLIAAGVGATWLATIVLRPAFGGSAMYYWAYGALGRSAPAAAWHVVTHPLAAARVLVTPGVKLTTLAWLLGSLAFLPLLSPIALAAVPLLAERMLASSAPGWWGPRFQYNAFVAVVLVCAAVDGAVRAARLISRLRAATRWPQAGGRVAAGLAAICAGLAVALVPLFPLGAALHPRFYRLTPRAAAAAAAVAAVPPGVTVETASNIGPQLSSRDTVLLWDWTPRWAPWVVADIARHQAPFRDVAAQRQRVGMLLHNGYRAVLDRDGYVVLRR